MPSPKPVFSPEAVYMLSGGMDGLGRSTLFWMLSYGARHLIVLSPTVGTARYWLHKSRPRQLDGRHKPRASRHLEPARIAPQRLGLLRHLRFEQWDVRSLRASQLRRSQFVPRFLHSLPPRAGSPCLGPRHCCSGRRRLRRIHQGRRRTP